MALSPGTRIGPYEITAPLGKGGMGEVYRATDGNLRRDVAIKVLPEGFAQDPERLGRFEREAQVLASLNHPNIAAIYGLEELEGQRCLVLELIEGDGLDEMVAAGPLPVERALPLALQIAEALEAAHEKGIVHRDLKPANIKVTPDGTVKVLDFGLAKAFADDSGQGSTDLSLSPTLTAMATQAGVIIGTAAYMSPEQAAGQSADRRADVWSFGVVLMEMLTGGKPFGGETVSHTLASVLKEEPQWERLPADLPPRLSELLRTCLRKKPRDRLQAIGDARRLLETYLADPEGFSQVSTPVAGVAVQVTPWQRRAPWVVAAALAAALLGTVWGLWPRPTPPPDPVRLRMPTQEGEILFRGYGSSVALSPDGSRLAYITLMPDGGRRLTLRSLDQWEGLVLVDDDAPYHPFFSPDGEWIGYVTRTELKKVPVRGGSSITLCDVALNRGASWATDGTIIFAPNPSSGLSRVPAAGGQPQPLTELDEEREETSHRWPQVLPGNELVLFTVGTARAEDFDGGRIELLDLKSGDRQLLHEGGTYARYVASGHILYLNRGTLFAFPFDLETRQATGSAAPVVEGVSGDDIQGGAHYSVSDNGILLYATGSDDASGTTMVWADRDGNFTPLWDRLQAYENPMLSPDGKRVAVGIETEGTADIWVYDLERDVPTRLTFGDGWEWSPVWSPDGAWIYYAIQEGVKNGILRVPSDGSGEPETILDADSESVPRSVSPDGTRLLFEERPAGNIDLKILDLDSGEVETFVQSSFINYGGRFSPDGRWIAYGSNESGTFEIYVRPADGGRGRWQISSEGSYPLWSADGRTLYYRRVEDKAVLAAKVEADGSAFRAGRPQVVFDGPFQATSDGQNRYAVAADDQRFLMLHEPEGENDGHEHLQLVLHWFQELERTFSGSGR
jgi:serine/threonine-protein kinase